MKLLKAYIRTRKVDETIRALKAAGAPGITVSRVHGIGYGYDSLAFTLAPSEVHKAPEVAKLEVVCGDDAAPVLLDALRGAASTGSRGDGIVFVTEVVRAVRIRTGEEGESALGRTGGNGR